MSKPYTEKRTFIRMDLELPMRIRRLRLRNQASEWVMAKNLSGRGLMFWSPQRYLPDELIEVISEPTGPTTPQLIAKVRVQRCSPLGEVDGQNRYEVGCFMQEVH